MHLLAIFMPGPLELCIIAVVAILLFGKKLPRVAYDMGNSLVQFKKGLAAPVEELDDCKGLLEDEVRDIKKAVK